MSPPGAARRQRTPPAGAVTALEIIRAAGRRRRPMFDFALRMSQLGVFAPELEKAKGALFRRGWAHAEGTTFVITDAGWLAATEGVGVSFQSKRQPSQKRKHNRMPSGLF